MSIFVQCICYIAGLVAIGTHQNCTCNLCAWLKVVVTVEGWSEFSDMVILNYPPVYRAILFQPFKREDFVIVLPANSEVLVCLDRLYLGIQLSLLAMSGKSGI